MRPSLNYPTKEQIADLRILLSSPDRWIKNAEAGVRTESGYEPCHYDDSRADCFDLVGAIAKVFGIERFDDLGAWLCRTVCPDNYRKPFSKAGTPIGVLADWNDKPNTAFDNIKLAIKRIAEEVHLRTRAA